MKVTPPPGPFAWQIVIPADRVILPDKPGTSAGHLTYHVNVIKIKKRNYMDKQVTPPK